MRTLTTETTRKKQALLLVLLAGLLLFVFLVSFCMGRYTVPITQVIKILFSRLQAGVEPTWTVNMETVVLNVRLPRILLACLVGCCLSAAGAAYQGVFQNPMVAPDILGATSGAAFGAALSILLGGSSFPVTLSAFFFSLCAVLLAYLVGERAPGKKVVNLILAGIMFSSIFSSGTSYIKLVADPTNQLPLITYWLMGSLSGTKLKDLRFVVFPMAIGLCLLLLVRWRLNLLTLGDDEARALGIHAGRLRLLVIIAATLITSASVSVSGMIGWVGLVVPHLCRKLVGNDYRYLLPASMMTGAAFLLAVDDVSRNLLATEIPIGILTSLIGAPFFLYLLLRKEAIQ